MTVTGVSEPKPGTMLDPEGRKSPEGDGKIPASGEVSPKETYTSKELREAVKAAENRVAKEVATYKAQAEKLQADLTDNATEIDKLQAKFDALAKDDPEKFDIAKELKLARDERKQLRERERAVSVRETDLADSKAEVDKWKRDQLVYAVADEFVTASGEAVDLDFFMTAADKFKLGEREELVALAETIGLKPKAVEPKPASVKPYSGATYGGAGDFSSLSPREKIDRGLTNLKKAGG